MKIIRWLLSHTFLILLIVVVIYGYMFWGNLIGKDTPAGKAVAYLSSEFVEVEKFVNAVKEKQAQLKSKKSPPSNVSSDDNATDVATINEIKQPATVIKNDDDVEISVTDVEKQSIDASLIDQTSDSDKANYSVPVALIQQKTQNSLTKGQETLKENKAELASSNIVESVSDTEAMFVSEEIERQLDNVNDQGEVLSESQRSEVVRETWISARKSFYQRNYDLSEKNYRKVISSTEDNFDAYGELGNVYFNQGKKQQAATAYFEAAAILVRKGQINRARSMVGLLKLLNKDKAQELQQLINAGLS